MFKGLKEFLLGNQESDQVALDGDGKPTQQELLIATAVILFEMAASDSDIDHAEAEALCSSMGEQFQVPEDEVPGLVQLAIKAKEQAGKIDSFVKLLNEHFNDGQKQRVLAMIWKVVLADGKIDKFEERFALQMQNRLRLSPEHLEAAKAMVNSGEV